MKKLIVAVLLALGLVIVIGTAVDVSALTIDTEVYGHAIEKRDLDGNYTCTLVSDEDEVFDGLQMKVFYGQCTNTLLEDEGRGGLPIVVALAKSDEDTYEIHNTVIGGTQTYSRELVYEFDYTFTYRFTM